MRKNCFIVLTLCLIMLLLAGCFSKIEDQGSLQIVARIPEKTGITQQFVGYELVISTVNIVLTKDGNTVSQSQTPTNTSATFTFSDLAVGIWDVQITAQDALGTIVCSGSGTADVAAASTGTSLVNLSLLPGDLSLQFDLPPALGVTSGTVQVINFSDGNLNSSQSLNIAGSTATATFPGLAATTWGLQLDLYAGGICVFSQGEPVDVLPGKSTALQVTITALGDMELQVDWTDMIPSQPAGLTAVVQPTGNYLSWAANPEANIAGYIVYRSNELTGVKQFLTNTLLATPAYLDTLVQSGETYYYWVQAFNTAGYSSSLSQPASIGVDTTKGLLVSSDSDGDGVAEIHLVENGTVSIVTTGSAPCWMPDGNSFIYVTSATQDVHLYSIDQNLSTQLTSIGNLTNPKISTSGNKIAFITADAEKWIYTLNPDGTGLMSIGAGMECALSPDGMLVAYIDKYTGALHVINSDGSNDITLPVEYCSRPQWSPDGNWILFSRVITDGIRVCKIRPDGTQLIQLSTMVSTNGSWSHDGTKIAYTDISTATPSLRVINADGSNDTAIVDNLTTGADMIHWSADDTKLAFLAAAGATTVQDLFVSNSDGTNLTNLTNSAYGEIYLSAGSAF